MPAFFQKMEKLKPVYDATYKVLLFLCKLLLIGDILITAWAVAGRYLPFITDPHWSEEMVLTLMVYMAVLSATLAISTPPRQRPSFCPPVRQTHRTRQLRRCSGKSCRLPGCSRPDSVCHRQAPGNRGFFVSESPVNPAIRPGIENAGINSKH